MGRHRHHRHRKHHKHHKHHKNKKVFLNIIIGLLIFFAGLYLYDYVDTYLWNNISNLSQSTQIIDNAKMMNYGSYVLMAMGGIITIKNMWRFF